MPLDSLVFVLPLAAVLAALAIAFIVSLWVLIAAWRRDVARRRHLANHCAACNYHRVGLDAGARCPECGSPATAGRGDDER